MSTPSKTPVIKRWHFLLFLAAVAIIVGTLVYEKAYADSKEAEVAAVEEPADPAPVEGEGEVVPAKPKDVEDPGAMEKLSSWVKQKKNEFLEDNEKIPLGSSGKSSLQEIPGDVAKRLEKVFQSNSDDVKQTVKRNAEVDAKQLDCVVKALFFEAGGEPELGQRWVYDVIRNRTSIEYRDNTNMCDTIFDNKQFSFANLNPDRVPKYSEDLIKVTALSKELYFDDNHEDITCGATHYLKKSIMWDVKWSRQALRGNSDEGLVLKAVIGDHAFFGKEGCERAQDQW